MVLPYIHASRSCTNDPQQDSFVMHTHDNYEIFCFLGGNAEYVVEGNIYPLEVGDVILMRKSEAHHLLLHSAQTYERITINFSFPMQTEEDYYKKLLRCFDDRSSGQFNRYSATTFKDRNWLYYLNKICDCSDLEQKAVYLMVLLEELSESFEIAKSDYRAVLSGSAEVLQYINRHLTEPLSLDRICKRFYISKSQLNRNFKKANGSTVWEYITAKRLLLAKEMLKNGGKPTEVYQQCGFADYVTFYRAYHRQFNTSPKHHSQ